MIRNSTTIRLIIFSAIIILAVAGALLFFRSGKNKNFPAIKRTGNSVQSGDPNRPHGTEVIADNLQIPWEIALFPDGDILMTERSGTIHRIGNDEFTINVEGVEHVGEGGLLGMALHPDFQNNSWIYLYHTTRTSQGLSNIVERYVLRGAELAEKKIIIENIPGSSNHNGGRIVFGPDNFLYITTGDAENDLAAQDTDSLAGKILRLKDDGSIPEDNPFGNPVFSYGHRNAQGLVWDDQDRLWASEHGRSGIRSGLDEINLIKKGANYGWPIIQGDEAREGMESPAIHSGPNETWAPAGIEFFDGSLYFVGLRGQALYRAEIGSSDNISSVEALFQSEFGRLRAIKKDAEGNLLVSTSNRDGRGSPKESDDKIIKIYFR